MILPKQSTAALSIVWTWVLVLVAVAIAAIGFYAYTLDKTMLGADRAEVLATWHAWKDAGSPTGTNFESWRSGRRADLVQHTNTYHIDGFDHRAVLAFQDLRVSGVMVVTTNGVVILVDQHGRGKIIK